ncbi:unnamed protein product [Bursaphelenchus xylophilus]|uniref:(pine wood nematode) hypothetical protein n=1 Tax=Bursaphelenchus xylophilus TaxID=6326 RepID=A0A1I7RR68_BURXY|nr:unnamed protein product [Bursaphelenchus xylophilus]CAG9130859.1 unnamed protein product [Bursaphelenchus xylophilus]
MIEKLPPNPEFKAIVSHKYDFEYEYLFISFQSMTMRSLLLLAVIAIGCMSNNIEDDEDRCTPGRCLNGGKCVEEENMAHCECKFGFKGEFCESRSFPVFNFFQHDPEYMYDHPKNPWSDRLETEAIKPILASSTQTIADVIERFYNNIQEVYNRAKFVEKHQQADMFFN